MRIHHHSALRYALTALVVGLASAGTAAAQGTPADPQTGAYGGATYGGQAAPAPAAQATPAPAEPTPAQEPAPVADVDVVHAQPAEKSLLERWGFALALGGGVEDFTHNGETGTNTGGNWNVRATLGTKQILAVEGSYIGSAQSIDSLGLDTDAVLLGNGLQGALRVNLITGMGLDFFGFGGAAWRHYDLTNQNFNTSDVRDSDDVLEIPLGVGTQFALQGFLVDVRGEYRAAYAGDLFAAQADQNMDRWGVQANMGFQF